MRYIKVLGALLLIAAIVYISIPPPTTQILCDAYGRYASAGYPNNERDSMITTTEEIIENASPSMRDSYPQLLAAVDESNPDWRKAVEDFRKPCKAETP